jgi:hypothetical protein
MPGRVLRLDDLAFRYLVIGVGLTRSGAFAVIPLFYQLELYGGGAMFSYAVAVRDVWAFHCPEIASSNRKDPTAVVARAAAKPLHHNVLATALATKLAWIVSTVLAHGCSYQARASRREQRKRSGST